MEEAKHTPGPWRVTRYEPMRGRKTRFLATRRNGSVVEAITKNGIGDSADAAHFFSEAATLAAIAKATGSVA